MNNQTKRHLLILSSLTLVLALAIWSPARSQPARPAEGMKMMEGKQMTDGTMMERCRAMMEQKQKMVEDMKAHDSDLTEHVAKMNSAPKDKMMSEMAAVITHMAESQVAMNARKAKMQEEMMKHMMQHMQMGKESMAHCPMMKGMMDMSEQPGEGKMKMERCQAMMDQKQNMMNDMAAQDAELTRHVARMNNAPENKKMSEMAAVITHMAESQVAMNARKAKMDEEMMKHMMQHMQMGKDSMSQCPMMTGMMGMRTTNE